MKLSTSTSIIALLLFAWPASAIFDQLFPQIPIEDEDLGGFGNFLNPDGFDVTRILECSEDRGGRLDVALAPASFRPGADPTSNVDFEYWLPAISGFPYPNSLRWASQNFTLVRSLLGCLQGIDRRVQALNAADIENSYDGVEERLIPWTLPNGFATFDVFQDLSYSFSDPMRDELPPICRSVRERLMESGDDINDDPDFITDSLIIGGIADANVTGLTLSPDMVGGNEVQRQNVRDVFSALQCQVVNAWRDLGPTFMPRFAIVGRCFNRGCGFPNRFGQMCRPDLREINYRRLEALRWDCCWELDDDPPTVDSRHTFSCGWRKVNIPVLCDCDCACPRPARPI